ncbi:MAG: Mitochondrial matrix cochaperone [Candelina mexicana]|nr:MAG: Mitochondrial matrix cochaperone [Candelina mexicana]
MIQRALLRQSRAHLPLRSVPSIHTSRIQPPASRLALKQTQRRIPARWYSATTEATKPSDGEVAAASEEGLAESKEKEEDSVKKELEAKNREIIDLKDKYLRSVADFRNLQDRTVREIKSAKDFAITRFANDLLDSVDNLERALSTVSPPPSSTATSSPPSSSLSSSPSSPPSTQTYPPQAPQETEDTQPSSTDISSTAEKDLKNLSDGLRMTERIFMQTLEKHGITRFDPSEKAEPFNPNLHEATFMAKQEGKVDGIVFHTQQKGFLLNGRVLRAAKVGVVKNS